MRLRLDLVEVGSLCGCCRVAVMILVAADVSLGGCDGCGEETVMAADYKEICRQRCSLSSDSLTLPR